MKLSFEGRLESGVFENEWRNQNFFRPSNYVGWDAIKYASSETPLHFDLGNITWVSPAELVKLAVIIRAIRLTGRMSPIISFPRGLSSDSMGIINLTTEGMAEFEEAGATGIEDPTEKACLLPLLPISPKEDGTVLGISFTPEQFEKAISFFIRRYLHESVERAHMFAQLFLSETVANAFMHGHQKKKDAANREEWTANVFAAAYIRRTYLAAEDRIQKFKESVASWELDWLRSVGHSPYLEIAVGDTGVGIAYRLGSNWREWLKQRNQAVPKSLQKQNVETIKYAFSPSSTTRTDLKSPVDRWKPRGLFILREQLRSYGGWVGIRSGFGSGAWDFGNDSDQFRISPTRLGYLPGTIVVCRLPLPIQERMPTPRNVLMHSPGFLKKALKFEVPTWAVHLDQARRIERLQEEFSQFLDSEFDFSKKLELSPVIVDCSDVNISSPGDISALVLAFSVFPIHTIIINLPNEPARAILTGREKLQEERHSDVSNGEKGLVTVILTDFKPRWPDISSTTRKILNILSEKKEGAVPLSELLARIGISEEQLNRLLHGNAANAIFIKDELVCLRLGPGEVIEYAVSDCQTKLKTRIHPAIDGAAELPGIYAEADTQYRLPTGRFGRLFIHVRKLMIGDKVSRKCILDYFRATIIRILSELEQGKLLYLYTETYLDAWLASRIVEQMGPYRNLLKRIQGPLDLHTKPTPHKAVIITDLICTGNSTRRMCQSVSSFYDLVVVITVFDMRRKASHELPIKVYSQFSTEMVVSPEPFPGVSKVRIVDPVTFGFASESDLIEFPAQQMLRSFIESDEAILSATPAVHHSGRFSLYRIDTRYMLGGVRSRDTLFPEPEKRATERTEIIFGEVARIAERCFSNTSSEEIALLIRTEGPIWDFRADLRKVVSDTLKRPVRHFELPVHSLGGSQGFGGTFIDHDDPSFEVTADKLKGYDVLYVDDAFVTGNSVRRVVRMGTAYHARRLCIVGLFSRLPYYEELFLRYINRTKEADHINKGKEVASLEGTEVEIESIWHLRAPVYDSFYDSPLNQLLQSYQSSLDVPLTPWAREFASKQVKMLISASTDPETLSVELQKPLEEGARFKLSRLLFREDLELYLEHVSAELGKVLSALNRDNPDVDDALISLLTYEPNICNRAHMTVGEVNYLPLRSLCIAVLRDGARSSEFKGKALRVLWFQQTTGRGPYLDSTQEIFDAALGGVAETQAAFFYFATALATLEDKNQVQIRLEQLENIYRAGKVMPEESCTLLWRNLRSLREIYRMQSKSHRVERSFDAFEDFCSLFLHDQEWHAGSQEPSGAPVYGTWKHMQHIRRELETLDETMAEIGETDFESHWLAVCNAFEFRMLPRISFVKSRLEQVAKGSGISLESTLNETTLMEFVGEVTSAIIDIKEHWKRWPIEDRRKRLNTLKEVIGRLIEIAFDGPARQGCAGSRLARLLEESQTRLMDVTDTAYRRAEDILQDENPKLRLACSVLTENNRELVEFKDLKSCVLGRRKPVESILENMLENVAKHGKRKDGYVRCEIVVSHFQQHGDFLLEVKISNEAEKEQNPDGCGVEIMRILSKEMGGDFSHWRDKNSQFHFQRAIFHCGYLPTKGLRN